MYRLLPFLFALAVVPESEKNLEKISSFILATKESVSNIRNGIDNFHSTMVPFMMAMRGENPEQTSPPPSAGKGE